MITDRYAEIDHVLHYIRQNLHEPVHLSKLASHAGYSPYHFTRVFKERTGLSPLYYVSSLRLQKAKDLLLHTHLSIRDIALEIGQQSLGTFTSRFTSRVGLTPSQFRNSTIDADLHLRSLQQVRESSQTLTLSTANGVVEGTVVTDHPFQGIILLGLFAKPIPEGVPLHGTLLFSLGRFRLTGVRPGTYYLMATSVSWGTKAVDVLLPHHTLRTRSREPVVVRPYEPVPEQKVTLYPPRFDDPPILISLPLLMQNYLSKSMNYSNR
ncbi:helix-turn-helix domain-containing protein [Paenibacillus sp. J22TS3]|uniref:helix-turn-helix domain-containing protein n=1 Tax=Paenibacillus sp. J22TS3 TaxID=2807192 RepID=UPI001B0A03DF|nr:AraC family transcriptional regulator [Paenibacillus sp. J22TS3]GIP23796.1 AraC family transcriptional regulator [Paenibacillus sp. J22TS3]